MLLHPPGSSQGWGRSDFDKLASLVCHNLVPPAPLTHLWPPFDTSSLLLSLWFIYSPEHILFKFYSTFFSHLLLGFHFPLYFSSVCVLSIIQYQLFWPMGFLSFLNSHSISFCATHSKVILVCGQIEVWKCKDIYSRKTWIQTLPLQQPCAIPSPVSIFVCSPKCRLVILAS